MIDNILSSNTMQAAVLRLLSSGWTSPLRALQEAQCLSLSQRVGEFLRDGLPIEKRWLKLENGKQVREYRLAPDGCYFMDMGQRDRLAMEKP
tara:strand:+ start:76 stop:351 length:276 start_codon:yes stop_codon:yes gene_type:complete